jgi:hypothetical protein
MKVGGCLVECLLTEIFNHCAIGRYTCHDLSVEVCIGADAGVVGNITR